MSLSWGWLLGVRVQHERGRGWPYLMLCISCSS